MDAGRRSAEEFDEFEFRMCGEEENHPVRRSGVHPSFERRGAYVDFINYRKDEGKLRLSVNFSE